MTSLCCCRKSTHQLVFLPAVREEVTLKRATSRLASAPSAQCTTNAVCHRQLSASMVCKAPPSSTIEPLESRPPRHRCNLYLVSPLFSASWPLVVLQPRGPRTQRPSSTAPLAIACGASQHLGQAPWSRRHQCGVHSWRLRAQSSNALLMRFNSLASHQSGCLGSDLSPDSRRL